MSVIRCDHWDVKLSGIFDCRKPKRTGTIDVDDIGRKSAESCRERLITRECDPVVLLERQHDRADLVHRNDLIF